MRDIQVIGIGDDGAAGLLPHLEREVNGADVLVGGERHLAFFPEFRGLKLAVDGKLKQLVDTLRLHQEQELRIVVLASGDPLFYGIGAYLAKQFENVVIHPHYSSVQLAFTKIGMGWQDAYVTSLHGKSIKGFAQRIDGRTKVAVLTDDTNTPAVIAAYLMYYGMTEYQMVVAENLGGALERVRYFQLEEVLEEAFAPLNVVILLAKANAPAQRWKLGMDDDQFAQRKPDKGLITKREVRVLSLAELGLREDSTIWDIGTCTGSVAIEAAKLAPQGQVFAMEKNDADLENARENARKFRTDITLVHGKAPEGLDAWPDPDAVFIGGSGGEMAEVLRICSERLRGGGRIVLNAATIETLYEATSVFAKLGLATRVTLTQISRSKPILHMTRFEGLNPIYIITAWKAEEEEQA